LFVMLFVSITTIYDIFLYFWSKIAASSIKVSYLAIACPNPTVIKSTEKSLLFPLCLLINNLNSLNHEAYPRLNQKTGGGITTSIFTYELSLDSANNQVELLKPPHF